MSREWRLVGAELLLFPAAPLLPFPAPRGEGYSILGGRFRPRPTTPPSATTVIKVWTQARNAGARRAGCSAGAAFAHIAAINARRVAPAGRRSPGPHGW